MDLVKVCEDLGLDENEYIEMIGLFFESGWSDLKKLKAAVTEGDAARAFEASHSLKGSTGSLGLTAIYDLTVQIDDRVRVGNLDGVAEMVKQLYKEYEKLVVVAEDFNK
jgi:HPt (histidine-containing phosphotransfer) domain-containing protein